MPPAINTFPLSSAVTVAPLRTSEVAVFNPVQKPAAIVTVAVGADAAAVPAPFTTLSVYVVVVLGATVNAVPLVRFAKEDPSLPTTVAAPVTTGEVPKSNTGVSVVELPTWITEAVAIRLVAFANGRTLTVTVEIAGVPAEGVTVRVYVSVPLLVPLTRTLPPLEIDVAVSVPLQEGAQDSVAAPLPVGPLPAKDANSVVVPPLVIVAVPLVAANVPTLKELTCALTVAVALEVCVAPARLVTVSV